MIKFLKIAAAATLLSTTAFSAHAGKADDTLRWASAYPVNTPDPYYNVSREMTTMMAPLVWDTLVYRDPETNEIVPGLAESWSMPDATTIEFKLRDGVTWQNGEPLTVADAVYTLNYIADPAHKIPQQSNYNWVKQAEDAGDNVLRLKLKAPFAPAFQYLAQLMPILPDGYYGDNDQAPAIADVVGTGPYKISEFTPGSGMSVTLTDNAWEGNPKGKPSIGTITYRQIPDPATQIAEVLSGGIDWIYNVNADQKESLAASPRLDVVTSGAIRFSNIQFNALPEISGAKNPLSDVRVRQAVAHAIDRQAIAEALVGPEAVVQKSACYETQFGCYQDTPQYEFNPERAKELLAEAGYPNGLTLDIQGFRSRDWLSAVGQYLGEAGIKTNIDFLPYTNAQEKLSNGLFQLYLHDDGSISLNDTYAFLNRLFAPNYDKTDNPKVAELLEAAMVEQDDEKRKQLYAEVLTLISEEVYMLPLWSHPQTYAVSKELDFKPWEDELPRFYLSSWK